MICEKCGKEFFEDWRKSRKARKKPCRFCSINCSNSRNISEEEKEKISKTLKEGYATGRIKSWNKGETKSENLNKFFKNKREDKPKTILELSSRTSSKILKRLNKPCSICGWQPPKNVALDIHHIIPISNGGNNEHKNLTYICPNCHRLAHYKIIKEEEFINLEEYLKNEWLEYYYG